MPMCNKASRAERERRDQLYMFSSPALTEFEKVAEMSQRIRASVYDLAALCCPKPAGRDMTGLCLVRRVRPYRQLPVFAVILGKLTSFWYIKKIKVGRNCSVYDRYYPLTIELPSCCSVCTIQDFRSL
ncbi:hypothetical protein Plhal304r1_c011g0043551 [Plasmopara halstedii]